MQLDTKSHFLSGTEKLWYWNNSPDTLDFVWIHLYPNAYRDRNTVFGREMEQQQQFGFSFASARDRGWIEVRKLRAAGAEVECQTRETELRVGLPQSLLPGDSVLLEFEFDVKIPTFFSRLGHKGKHYVISQWYPKMVVYDPEVRGRGPRNRDQGTGVRDRRTVASRRLSRHWRVLRRVRDV